MSSAKVKSEKRRKKRRVNPVKRILTTIGTIILSVFLLIIITGSLIAAILTMYITQFADDADLIDISNIELDYSTFIYATDENGQRVELKKISRAADRIPVDIDQIPQHVQDAFVYIEDMRFFEHEGVDWRRTFGAFLNEMFHIWGSRQGGSTITQQLVKNVTGDDAVDLPRKIREIFRAAKLEEFSTKQDILEAYLNVVGFGGATAGIEAASLKYFDKHVWELDVAEAASLAAIPKSPEANNPYAVREDENGNVVNIGLKNNKDRQELVLDAMLESNAISEAEYEKAIAKPLNFKAQYATSQGGESNVQSWFVDEAIRDVTLDLASLYGVSFDEASDMLYNGGYEVYTTVDIEMQAAIEAKFADYTTFSEEVLVDPPQASFICMDYQGNIKAIVGGIGTKAGDNIFNRATRALRSPGSCIKPITSYSYAIQNNMITWSTPFINQPLKEIINDDGDKVWWPHNYNTRAYDYNAYFTYQALQRSLNTIPAQLIEWENPGNVFDFLQTRYHVTSLSPFDADLSPLAVGALTNGISLKELVAAYQPFGNQGIYCEPHTYTQVLDSQGRIILQNKIVQYQALDKPSAYLMNRLMTQVIEGPNGTGRAAKLETTRLIGKTGTSQDWYDLLFIGATPEYVSGVWYGYDVPKEIPTGTYYSSSTVWKNIFGEIADQSEMKEFVPSSEIVERYFCTQTGLLAGAGCPTGDKGYYKQSFLPAVCDGNHTKLTDFAVKIAGEATLPPEEEETE
jgi:penicillin-binding protein 1A